MIYYGYTDKNTQDPPKTLLQYTGDKILEEVEKSLYNTLIQVPLHHFYQVYNSLNQHSNTVAIYDDGLLIDDSIDSVHSLDFTYIDISSILEKVKSQIIGELKHEC